MGSDFEQASALTSTNIGDHEDTAIISARMKNGVLGQINCNWITPYKSRHIRVATKTRYVTADLITQQVKEYSQFKTYDASYSVREWPVVYREPVKEELNAFLNAIKTGNPTAITGEDGLKVLETIEALG